MGWSYSRRIIFKKGPWIPSSLRVLVFPFSHMPSCCVYSGPAAWMGVMFWVYLSLRAFGLCPIVFTINQCGKILNHFSVPPSSWIFLCVLLENAQVVDWIYFGSSFFIFGSFLKISYKGIKLHISITLNACYMFW